MVFCSSHGDCINEYDLTFSTQVMLNLSLVIFSTYFSLKTQIESTVRSHLSEYLVKVKTVKLHLTYTHRETIQTGFHSY